MNTPLEWKPGQRKAMAGSEELEAQAQAPKFTSPLTSDDKLLHEAAIEKVRALPAAIQDDIMKIVAPDERILYLERPSWIRANISLIVATTIGSVAFVVMISLGWVSLNLLPVLAAFPIALAATLYSLFRHRSRYFLLTDQRIISKPGWGSTVIIPYVDIMEVSSRLNCLLCLRELQIKRQTFDKARRSTRPKVEFIDSIPDIEFYKEVVHRKQRDAAVLGAVGGTSSDEDASDDEDEDVELDEADPPRRS